MVQWSVLFYESVMSNLEPSLPMFIRSTQDADVVFLVCSLGSVYASAVSSSAMKWYLESLEAIAQASGKCLQDVLQTELQKISALNVRSKNLKTLPRRRHLCSHLTN